MKIKRGRKRREREGFKGDLTVRNRQTTSYHYTTKKKIICRFAGIQ